MTVYLPVSSCTSEITMSAFKPTFRTHSVSPGAAATGQRRPPTTATARAPRKTGERGRAPHLSRVAMLARSEATGRADGAPEIARCSRTRRRSDMPHAVAHSRKRADSALTVRSDEERPEAVQTGGRNPPQRPEKSNRRGAEAPLENGARRRLLPLPPSSPRRGNEEKHRQRAPIGPLVPRDALPGWLLFGARQQMGARGRTPCAPSADANGICARSRSSLALSD